MPFIWYTNSKGEQSVVFNKPNQNGKYFSGGKIVKINRTQLQKNGTNTFASNPSVMGNGSIGFVSKVNAPIQKTFYAFNYATGEPVIFNKKPNGGSLKLGYIPGVLSWSNYTRNHDKIKINTIGKKFVVFPMSTTFKITKNEFNKLTKVRNNNSVYRTENAQSRSYRIQHARTNKNLNAINQELGVSAVFGHSPRPVNLLSKFNTNLASYKALIKSGKTLGLIMKYSNLVSRAEELGIKTNIPIPPNPVIRK
jgi:hypothetical protein